MWSYYGGKGRVVDYYPKPMHNKIIEPFAGSARYSLKHFENDVHLYDKYEAIIECWKFLQECSKSDILSLPVLPSGSKYKESDFDCRGQYILFGYMTNQGAAYVRSQVSKWGSERFVSTRKRIAENIFKIKHWTIQHADYIDLEDEQATWFIDAPYQSGGLKYKFNKINFPDLSKFYKSRSGQVIVCENTNATWMNFSPMVSNKGLKYTTTECIWTNYPICYHNIQTKLQF